MALTTCNDCGHEISENAVSCPSCGAPGPTKQQGISVVRYFFTGVLLIIIGFFIYYVAAVATGPGRDVLQTQPLLGNLGVAFAWWGVLYLCFMWPGSSLRRWFKRRKK